MRHYLNYTEYVLERQEFLSPLLRTPGEQATEGTYERGGKRSPVPSHPAATTPVHKVPGFCGGFYQQHSLNIPAVTIG